MPVDPGGIVHHQDLFSMVKTNARSHKLAVMLRMASLYALHPFTFRVLQYVQRKKLSFLNRAALLDLSSISRQMEKRNIPGIFIEAGCGLGGSTMVIASSKDRRRPLFVYDTFEMIPSPSDQDGRDAQERYQQIISGNAQGVRGGEYYGYVANLVDRVKENFRNVGLPVERNNVTLIKGLFQETMSVDQPVSFAHIDCDWYDSVITCLNQIEPRLSPGGVLVIDDYLDWSGCHKAIEAYFEHKKDQYDFIFKTRLHIRKKK